MLKRKINNKIRSVIYRKISALKSATFHIQDRWHSLEKTNRLRFFKKKIKLKNPRHNSPKTRKERSENRLLDLGIDYNPHLPEITIESHKIRSAKEVASKVIATWEVINVAQNTIDSDRKESVEFLKDIELWNYLSPNEQIFLSKTHHDRQTVIDFSWKTEAIKALYWALDDLDSLGEPTEDDSLQKLSDSVYSKHSEIDEYFKHIKLRADSEIFDEADFIFRLHWSSRSHRSREMGVPKTYNYSVISERDFALRWLIDSSTNWDEISLDT